MNKFIKITIFTFLYSFELFAQNQPFSWCDVGPGTDLWLNQLQSLKCGPLSIKFEITTQATCKGDPIMVTVSTNSPLPNDSTLICWGDGKFTEILSNTQQQFSHIYYPSDPCPSECKSYLIRAAIIRNCSVGRSFVWSSGSATICFPPIANFTVSANSICPNDQVCPKNNSCKNSPLTTFQWSMQGASIPGSTSENPPCFSYANNGNYSINLVMKDPANPVGCQESNYSIPIVVNQKAIAAFSMPTEACVGETISVINMSMYEAAPVGQSPWLWTQVSGPSGGLMFIPPYSPTDREPKFKFTKKGTYRIKLDVKGCSLPSVYHDIIVRDKPSSTISLPSNKCAPFTLTIDASNWAFDPGGFPISSLTYLWTIMKPNGTTINSTSQYPSPITCDVPGIYKISAITTNPCGSTPDTQTFTVGERPKAKIEYVMPSDFCLNTPKTIVFLNKSVGSDLITTWEPIQGATSTTIAGGISVTFSLPGTYTIRLTVRNNCPIPNSDTQTVTLVFVGPPTISKFATPGPCEGDSVQFLPSNLTLNTGGLPCQCRYQIPNLLDVTVPCDQKVPGRLIPGPGPHTVTVTVSNDCDKATATALLNFSKKPIPAFAVPNTFCLSSGLLRCKDESLVFSSLTFRRWELLNAGGTVVAQGGSNATADFSIATPGTYTVRLRVGNGCDTLPIEKQVAVYALPTVPVLKVLNNSPCGTGTAQIEFQFTDGGGTPVITWECPGGTPATAGGSTPPNPYYDKPGTYTITVKVDNKECPPVTQSVTFTVAAIPTADVKPLERQRCLPASRRFELQAKSGVKYNLDISPKTGWHLVSGTLDAPNAEIEIDSCGIYTYTFTASNACKTEKWTHIDTFYKKKRAIIRPVPNFCQRATLDFSATSFDWGCSPEQKVLWHFPGGNPEWSEDLRPKDIYFESLNQPQNVAVELTVFDSICGNVFFTTSFRIDAPEKLIADPKPIARCKNDQPFTLQADVPGGQWYKQGQPTSPVINPQNLSAGEHWFVYQKGSGTCLSKDSIKVTIWALPALDAGKSVTVCLELGQVLLMPTSTFPVVWQSSDPRVTFNGNTAFFSDSLVAVLTATVEDPNTKCVSKDTLTLTVLANDPLPVPPAVVFCKKNGLVPLPLTQGNPRLRYFGPGVVDSLRFNPLATGTGPTNTLIWINTNTYGCTASGSIQINIQELLAPGALRAGRDTAICQNGSVLVLNGLPNTNGLTWLNRFGQVVSTNGMLSIDPKVFTRDTVLTFVLAYLHGTENCGQYDTVRVRVVFAEPDAGLPQTACLNAPTQTLISGTPAPSGYTSWWSPFVGLQDSIKGAFSPSLLGVGEYDVFWNLRNENYGCVFTDPKKITIEALPGSLFTIKSTRCAGVALGLDNPTPNATKQNWYVDGKWVAAERTPSIKLDSGTYTIVLVSETLYGCKDTFSQTIYVKAPPRVALRPDKTEGCGPLLVRFKNYSTSATTLTYMLSGNGASQTFPATDSLRLEQGDETVGYTLRLVAENECAKVEDTVHFTVFPNPKAVAEVSLNQVCSGQSVTVLVNSRGNPQADSVFTSQGWAKALRRNVKDTLRFFTGDEVDTVTLWFVCYNFCGTDTVVWKVVVKPSSVKALACLKADTMRVCANVSLPVRNCSTPGAYVEWLASNGNKYLGDSIALIFDKAGLFKITLRAFGCGYDTINFWVRVLPSPTLNIKHPKQACPGIGVPIEVSTNASGLLLRYGDGDTTRLATTFHVYKQPGTYFLTVLAESAAGCMFELGSALEILVPPQAVLLTPDTICAKAPGKYQSLSLGASTCVWDMGNGQPKDGCEFFYAYPQPGLYTVVLTAISDFGCRDTAQRPVYVRTTSIAQATVTVLKSCTPAKAVFTNMSSNATDWHWEFGDGKTAGALSPVSHTFEKAGQYKVLLIATREGVCPDTFVQIIEALQSPSLDLTLDPNCTIRGGVDLAVNTSAWNYIRLNGPNGYGKEGSFHDSLPAGEYRLFIQDRQNNCTADTLFEIAKVNELLLFLAQGIFNLRLGDSITIDLSTNQRDATFNWTPARGLSDATLPDPVARPFTSTRYNVQVTDQLGCHKDTFVVINIRVSRDSGIFIPDAFTPNDDLVNDVFIIFVGNLAVAKVKSLRIWDRWDELVFEAENYNPFTNNAGWDGTLKSGKAEQGLYHYEAVIEYIDKDDRGTPIQKTFRGNILLIR